MSRARYLVGDVFERLADVPDCSVDLVLSSPPFLALRKYLPDDHPDKDHELGSEATPADYLDAMLDVTEACRSKLTPWGSLVFEFGDTYSGSGGHGGDYAEGGMREGQPKFEGAAKQARRGRSWRNALQMEERGLTATGGMKDRAADIAAGIANPRARPGPDARDHLEGWPLDKSLVMVPELYAASLAYGRNLLRPERETPRWRVRNFSPWVRRNPSPGRDGDKFRPATSFFTVACTATDRYFDGYAIRVPGSENSHPRTATGVAVRPNDLPKAGSGGNTNRGTLGVLHSTDGAPQLDWFEFSGDNYTGAHYATWPRGLLVPFILSMSPTRACSTCGAPSRRILEPTAEYAAAMGGDLYAASLDAPRDQDERGTQGRVGATQRARPSRNAAYETTGWTICGHGTWRPGVVLDPFAGSGTTLLVATGHGREAIGIDVDDRNADLALERVGPLLLDVDWR